jgi:hypothetical protein
VTGKPTVSELGIDLAAQVWRRSGHGDGAIEVAFARAGGARAVDTPASDAPAGRARADDAPADDAPADGAPADGARDGDPAATEWVLMRVAGDPAQRVLVFDRHEWECFLDGARHGEFDDAAASP